jgi:DNA-binding response OmpR family regulator
VLVCDDDPWIRETLKAIVESHGYRVTLVDSGAAAVASAARERPDVVLLDLMMPGMDGWATAAALRRQPATTDVPVVILSALSRGATDPVAAEVVAWLEKPMDTSALVEALRSAVRRAPRRARILIAEPDREIASGLKASFERHALDVHVADSAAAAIELAAQVDPDLLVLDLALEGGEEVVEWIGRCEPSSRAQLLMYSGEVPGALEARVLDLLGSLTFDVEP